MKEITTVALLYSWLFPRKTKADVSKTGQSLFTTSANRTDLRLTKTDTNLQFKDFKQPLETQDVCLSIQRKHFRLFGYWWRNNGCRCYFFTKLTKENQQEFLDAYYDKEKRNYYSIIRTTIASFSSGSYTYIEEGMMALKRSILAHDKEFRIPLIKKAKQQAGWNLYVYRCGIHPLL
jgi:glucosylceramidase